MKAFALAVFLAVAMALVLLDAATDRWPHLILPTLKHAGAGLALGGGLAAVAIIASSASDLSDLCLSLSEAWDELSDWVSR